MDFCKLGTIRAIIPISSFYATFALQIYAYLGRYLTHYIGHNLGRYLRNASVHNWAYVIHFELAATWVINAAARL